MTLSNAISRSPYDESATRGIHLVYSAPWDMPGRRLGAAHLKLVRPRAERETSERMPARYPALRAAFGWLRVRRSAHAGR